MNALGTPLLVTALALASGCRGAAPGPRTDSETHFLSYCSRDESCGAGLECLCGVCTASCAEAASCRDLDAAAECLTLGSRPADQSCAEAAVDAVCEVECRVDADCAPLGAAHRCDRGFCRQLAEDCEPAGGPGSEVVVLGDSFLGESHQFTAELEALARAAGALGAEDEYRDYSSSLVTPFGGAADLADQYATARAEGTPRFVVMNAGGPELLLDSCPEPLTEACPALQSVVAGADALWREMARDGVEAVIDLFHPYPADGTVRAKLDVLRPLLQATCEASPVGCHFLDLQPTFQDRQDLFLFPGGFNPTAAGAEASAAAVFSLMQRRCIGQ